MFMKLFEPVPQAPSPIIPNIQVPPPTAFTIDAPKPGNAVRKTKATKQPCTEVIFAAEKKRYSAIY